MSKDESYGLFGELSSHIEKHGKLPSESMDVPLSNERVVEVAYSMMRKGELYVLGEGLYILTNLSVDEQHTPKLHKLEFKEISTEALMYITLEEYIDITGNMELKGATWRDAHLFKPQENQEVWIAHPGKRHPCNKLWHNTLKQQLLLERHCVQPTEDFAYQVLRVLERVK